MFKVNPFKKDSQVLRIASPCNYRTAQTATTTTMSSTLTLPPPPPDVEYAAAMEVHTLLNKFGLLGAFRGTAQALEGTPAPSSPWEAWVLLSTKIARSIKTGDTRSSESKGDATAVMLSVFVETLVRSSYCSRRRGSYWFARVEARWAL